MFNQTKTMETMNVFDICRLCLDRSQCLIYIFEVNGKHGYIAAEVITDLLQFKVFQTDGYPPFVCYQCLDKLTDFKIFKDQCINSRITFVNEISPKCILEDQQYQACLVSVKTEEKNESDIEVAYQESYHPENLEQEKKEFEEEDFSKSCLVSVKTEEKDERDVAEAYQETTANEDEISRYSLDDEIEIEEHCPDIKMETGDEENKGDYSEKCGGDDSRHSSIENVEIEALDEGIAQCVPIPFPRKNLVLLKKELDDKTNEKPFRCDKCGWRFTSLKFLKYHYKIHLGDKPFACDSCTSSFMNRALLKKHQIMHSSERPFQCVTCLMRFSRKSNLVSHLRVHTGERPFLCAECGRRFAWSGDLTKHLRIHAGEKPHKCVVCPRRFLKKSDLVEHLRVHSGEKPYNCTVCNKWFKRTSDLSRHYKVHYKRD